MENLVRKFIIDETIPRYFELLQKKSIEICYISKDPLIYVKSESNGLNTEFYICFEKDDGKRENRINQAEYDSFASSRISETNVIEKDEYYFPIKDNVSSRIHSYKGELEGLTILELRFEDEEQLNAFSVPSWFKKELGANVDDYVLSHLNKRSVKKIILNK